MRFLVRKGYDDTVDYDPDSRLELQARFFDKVDDALIDFEMGNTEPYESARTVDKVSDTFAIEISPSAKKDFKGLGRSVEQWAMKRIKMIADNVDEVRHKVLTGGNLRGAYTSRTGDYRTIYALNRNSGTLCVLAAGHRKQIYDLGKKGKINTVCKGCRHCRR